MKKIFLLIFIVTINYCYAAIYTTQFAGSAPNYYNAANKWLDGAGNNYTIDPATFNFSNNTYNIEHTVNFASRSSNIQNSILTVKSGATLSLSTLNNSTVIVEAGATLIITGNATQIEGGTNKIINYGTVGITGNLSDFASIETKATGTTTVNGNVKNTKTVVDAGGTLTINGSLSRDNDKVFSFSNAGTTTISGEIQATNTTNSGTLMIGSIGNAGNNTLIFNNSGTASISSAQSYSGDKRTIINTGILNFTSTLEYNNKDNSLTNSGTVNIGSTFYYKDGPIANNAGGKINIGGDYAISTNNTITNAGDIIVNGALTFNFGTMKNTGTANLIVKGTGSFLNSNAYFDNAGFVEFSQLLTITNAIIKNSIAGDPGHINAKSGIKLENSGCIDGGSVDYWGSLTSNNSFSQCDLSSKTILPISIEFIKAENAADGIKIDWRTATELNNEIFILEKSINGLEYTTIEIINGAGTTSIQHDYSYADNVPSKGINYYRLSQKDFDGQKRYFAPIAIHFSRLSAFIYPTVIQDGTAVNIVMDNDDETVLFRIINQEGKVISTGTVSNDTVLSSELFSYGLNTLLIGSDNNLMTTSIVKQ